MSIWNDMTVLRVESAFTVPSEKGRFLEIRGRQSYGLTFCLDGGEIVYRMNGREFVSDRFSAVLLPMDGHYTLHGTRTGEFPLINFECDLPPLARDIVACPLRNPESYLKRYEQIRTIMMTSRDRAKIMSVFYDILSDLAHEEESEDVTLAPATEYLASHFGDTELLVATLARTVNLSEAYFRKLFKSAYGISPKQYLLELRTRQAKQLLLEKSLTVTAIADACGFASVYHFCRAFKGMTGQTPTEYARQQIKG